MVDSSTRSVKIDKALSVFFSSGQNGINPTLPIWMQSVYDQVSKTIIAGRLPHAISVQGDSGIGIEVLAGAIASTRLCDQVVRESSVPSAENHNAIQACGQCKSCELLVAGSHPDIRVLEPSGAANLIKVDQVRDLIGFLAQTPQISQWKIAWINDAHRMNQNAANALLKVLEEPQGDSLIVLSTDRPQTLLPTVRSRCRALNVNPPSESQTLDFCLANGMSNDDIQGLVPVLGCRPQDIVAWTESDTMASWQQLHDGLEQINDGGVTTQALTDALKDVPLSSVLHWLIGGVEASTLVWLL